MTIPIDRGVEQSIIIKEEATTFDPAKKLQGWLEQVGVKKLAR